MSDTARRTGDRIRKLMSDHGVSQTHIGDSVGISQQQVSERLAGRVDFKVGELRVIARELDISVAELIGGPVEVTP